MEDNSAPTTSDQINTVKTDVTEPRLEESSILEADKVQLIQNNLGEDLRITMNERPLYLNERKTVESISRKD